MDVKVRSFANYEVPAHGIIDVARVPTEAEQAFADSCAGLALSLVGMGAVQRDDALVEAMAKCEMFYRFEGNGAGGSLHVVLDDYNTERDTVAYCMKYASGRGDIAGAQLALLLLALRDDEIDLAVRGEPKQQCGDCGAEILGFHGACEGVPGGFGDEP